MADRPFVGAESNYDYGGSRLDRYCDRCGLLPAWCSCPPLTAEEGQQGAHVVVSVNGQPIESVDSIECPKDTGTILGKQGTMEMRVASSTVPGVPAVAPEPERTTPAALAIRDVWPPSADATSALHELAARLIAQAKL